MIILHQKQFSSQNLISEIKKEFPKFIMSPTSDKFFKKAGEFKIICGDLYVLDSEGIIGLNKILTALTGEGGSERLVIAAVGELELLACIESKTGKTTVWQRVGRDSRGDSFKCTLAVNSPEEFFNIYSDYLRTKASKTKKDTRSSVNPNMRKKNIKRHRDWIIRNYTRNSCSWIFRQSIR